MLLQSLHKIRRRENWGLVEVEEAATSAEGDTVNLLLNPLA